MKKSERLKLSEQSFTKLRKEKFPVDLLTDLEELKDIEYTSLKQFGQDVEKQIGKERAAEYGVLIRTCADTILLPQKSVTREYIEAFLIAIVLALIIRTFIVEAFKIPSGSMEQTLLVGDHLLVNKFIYRFTDPKRGDVIVFKYPDNPSRNFIKRIIGIGGDTIEVRDKVLYVNGQSQSESYIQHVDSNIQPANLSPRDSFGPVTVPQNAYFMMGDNRDSSLDSRFWKNTFARREAIVGKAMIIYWSWNDDSMDIPEHESFLQAAMRWIKDTAYNISHLPSSVRWKRLARLIK